MTTSSERIEPSSSHEEIDERIRQLEIASQMDPSEYPFDRPRYRSKSADKSVDPLVESELDEETESEPQAKGSRMARILRKWAPRVDSSEENAAAELEAKESKIIKKATKKIDNITEKNNKATDKVVKRAQNIHDRAQKQLDKIEDWKARKQEQLQMNRRQRIGSHLGRFALGFSELASSYSARKGYGSYGHAHRMKSKYDLTVADIAARI